MCTVRELKISTRDGGSIAVLYYETTDKNAPLLVEIHGGGFIYGSARDDEVMCRTLSEENGVNVASVDYRLAPKYVYPTATNDCEDALRTLIADKTLDFDREKIAVIGSSAGANLATGLCGACRDVAGVRGQILVYPFLNCRDNNRKYVFGSFMRAELNRFNNKYFADKSRRGEFAASPVLGTEDDFNGLPQALIVTAGRDTLKPDGVEYAKRLTNAGIKCLHVNYPSAKHGYFETVSNGSIKKWWWISAKSREEQRACHLKTLAVIGDFLKNIFNKFTKL